MGYNASMAKLALCLVRRSPDDPWVECSHATAMMLKDAGYEVKQKAGEKIRQQARRNAEVMLSNAMKNFPGRTPSSMTEDGKPEKGYKPPKVKK